MWQGLPSEPGSGSWWDWIKRKCQETKPLQNIWRAWWRGWGREGTLKPEKKAESAPGGKSIILLPIWWTMKILSFQRRKLQRDGAELFVELGSNRSKRQSQPFGKNLAPCVDRVAIKLLKAGGKWSQRLYRIILLISDSWKNFRAMEGGFQKCNVKASTVSARVFRKA